MRLALPVCAVLLALPLLGKTDEPTETVFRLKVQPAAAPNPALRYQLLPEFQEMEPGNAVLGFLKCFMEEGNFFYSKAARENHAKWAEMPVKDLPVKEVRAFGYRSDGVLFRNADYAARLDHADWQALVALRREGYNLLLPEVAQMRDLATVLVIRLRADAAERHFDDALNGAKTLMALARDINEHPTAIAYLIAGAVTTITLDPLGEMLQQPGCPNLYWALTDLPDPLVSPRLGVQGERVMVSKIFQGLDDKKAMTEAQIMEVVDGIIRVIRDMTPSNRLEPPQRDPRSWLVARAGDDTTLRAARRRLIASGLFDDRVNRFPPLQVMLLQEKLDNEILRDEGFKALSLPYWQAEPLMVAAQPGKGASKDRLFGGGALVLPVLKLRQNQARIQRRIGLLRCVEALRMYAAENEGRLPARFEDVPVPVPVDPFTGKSFLYRVEGGTAIIRGTPPTGLEKNASYNVRYEVTIVK